MVIVGDIACEPDRPVTAVECQHEATAALVDQLNPDVIALAGDVQYDRGETANFKASFDRTWGRFADRLRPAPGNHDFATPGGAGYFDYFASRGVSAGDRGKGWYRYQVGAWEVFALNSNCALVGCDEGSEQLAWLTGELAASTAACTLAYWHHPRFSSGLPGDSLAVAPLFEALHAAGADVVVSGHDHDHERFGPRLPTGALDQQDGIRQFVVGTGGRSLYPIPVVHGLSEARVVNEFGVVELTLSPGSYRWRFVGLGTGSDEGEAPCR
ncbi:MAG: metallophosphoesterase family protein [Acidimicrobiales bacterium]